MMHAPPGQGLVQQEAMADLYERYWFIVLRTIHQYISSHEDAEDVLLDVFLAALESDVFFNLVELWAMKIFMGSTWQPEQPGTSLARREQI